MARTVLEVVLAADPRSLDRGLKQGSASLDKFGKQAKSTSAQVGVSFRGLGKAAGAAGVAMGAAGLASGLRDAVKAAGESEKVQSRLQAQLRASGISYRVHAGEIDKVIAKTSKLSALDDEDLGAALTNLVQRTGSLSQSYGLLGTASDLARAKNLDVAKAAELVGRVADGNVNALSRYGVKVREGATAQEALAQVQRTFAGQAEAYGKTSAGAFDRLNVATGNLKEQIGAQLAPALARAANAASSFLSDGGFQRALGSVRSAVQTAVASISSGFSRARSAVTSFASNNREELQAVGRAFRNVAAAVRTAITEGVIPVVRRMLPGIQSVVGGVVTALRGMVRIVTGILTLDLGRVLSGVKDVFGGAFRAGIGAIRAATAPMREAASRVGSAALGGLKGAFGKASEIGKEMVSAVVRGIKSVGSRIGSALESLVPGPVKGIIGKLTGDGIGAPPMGNVGSVNLDGASSALMPFARIGAAYGLRVSDGKRPGGTRTSSGGISYHGAGQAIDLAGPPAAMLKTFRVLKYRYGSRLAELIHTPGGVGIKDGRPFKYSGPVARDHYDHVHVAFTGGSLGRQLGGNRTGDGYGMGNLEALWKRAGGAASAANIAAAVAMAESGGNPRASNRNRNGTIDRGLWQINSVHGAKSTFDPVANARAAVSISGNGRNWRPWVAFTNGRYRRFLSAGGGATTTTRKAATPRRPKVLMSGSLQNGTISDPTQRQFDADAKRREEARTPVAAAVSADTGGGGDTGETRDPNVERLAAAQEEANRINAELARLVELQIQEQRNTQLLVKTEGTALVGAVTAAINGDIGGRVGLAYQSPGFPGATVRYAPSTT
jgi:hypothetical protein